MPIDEKSRMRASPMQDFSAEGYLDHGRILASGAAEAAIIRFILLLGYTKTGRYCGGGAW